uniref:EEF1A lysine methyltransferase 2 n=1 Tax=Strix occidentalis caurina TaxID=311401 RepID=A0A8D0EQ32_STROC
MAVAGERPGHPAGPEPGPGPGRGEEPFSPSVLGTREHWDAAYERELQTFQDIGDAGEIWFGEESMVRIIRWLEKQKVPLDSSVLDIGTGNGVLLIELAKSGYMNLTGIDYSPSAIQLSEKVREKEGMSNIKLKVEDFLAPSAELSGFEICIDKGTFDAISLNPDNAVGKRKQYVRSLCSALKPEGFFLITSCNWTKEELLNEFREGKQLNRTTCQFMVVQGCNEEMLIANVPREDRFCHTLEDEDFSLVRLGRCIYPGGTLLVLYHQIHFTHPIALKSG